MLSPTSVAVEPEEKAHVTQCSVCYTPMIKGIFGCPNGHVWCDTCNVHLLQCPFDRDRSISRLRVIEEFLNENAESVKCHYCDVTGKRADVGEHLDKCEQRPIRPCDFWVFNPGKICTFEGSRQEVLQHLESPTSGHAGLMFKTVASGEDQLVENVCVKIGRMFLVKSTDDDHLWAAVGIFYFQGSYCIFVRCLCHHKHQVTIRVTKGSSRIEYTTQGSSYDQHALTIRNSMNNILRLPSVFSTPSKTLDGVKVSVTFEASSSSSSSSSSKKRKVDAI